MAMIYKSLGDLSISVAAKLCYLPHDIDLVVGVPRSGMLPATLIALYRGIQLLSLDAYLAGVYPLCGQRIGGHSSNTREWSPKKVLVVDDSCNNGIEMQRVKRLIADSGVSKVPTLYAAVYATPGSEKYVDFVFESLHYPRLFEWNILAHPILENCCVDLDGVLCRDPLPSENDDGINYIKFLLNAEPLFLPRRPVGEIVTSRLEKYRSFTEAWLTKHGVEFKRLTMLDGVTADERRRRGLHPLFKAQVYKASKSPLFIESSESQAKAIASNAGKPVFCVESRTIYMPDRLDTLALTARGSVGSLIVQATTVTRKLKAHIVSRLVRS